MRMEYLRHKKIMKICVVLIAMVVFLIEPTSTYAITQPEVTSKLNSLMGQYVGTTWNGYDMGSQCKGFANMIFRNLFGVYIGPYPTSANYKIENANAVEVGVLSPSSMTQSAATELLKKGEPGDYIQVRRRSSGNPHSMIVVNKDSGGITVFDCNSDGRNSVRSYYITWDSFYKSNCAVSLYHAKNYEVQVINNPTGEIDSVTGGTGSVTVRGWAYDKDALSEALDIHVYIGGPAGSGAPCYIIKANKERTDVPKVYPGVGSYHGYNETLETDRTGTQDIYIYAINKGGGYNTLLGYKTVTIIKTSYNPTGEIDSVTGGTGSITVRGWAYDKDALSEALDIHVYIGGPAGSGAPCYIIKANKERADVPKVYPGVGSYHGYNETLETGRTGTQDIYIYAINKGGGYNTLLGYKTVTIKKQNHPTGVYESATGGAGTVNVKGWAYDADDVSRALDIHVYIGGECGSSNAEKHSISANKKRTDVENVYPGTGNYHGFNANITTNKTGKQKVYVYAINIGGGSNQLLGCKEVTIQEKPRSVESVSILNEKGYICRNTWIDSVNKSIILQAEVYPENADNKKVIWSSEDSSIVAVDSEGRVTAKKNGAAFITATTEDGNYSSKCLVKVGLDSVIYGDINFDGNITASDLSTMNNVLNGTMTVSEAERVILDLNGDSKVTQEDKELLVQFILGEIDTFPVETMLSEIKITKEPDMLSYYVGDTLKTTGMQVTAVYRNGSSKVVTGYSVSADLSAAGERKATVTYSEAEVTRTAAFTVQVSSVSLNKILITRKPDKTSYVKGEEMNTTGMIVKAQYTNGTTKTVTDYIVESIRNFAEGEQQVKITYEENGIVCTAYFDIMVIGICESYGHAWNAGVVTKEATDSENGIKTYTCTKCNAVKTEVLPAMGQKENQEPTVPTTPGESEEGNIGEGTETGNTEENTEKDGAETNGTGETEGDASENGSAGEKEGDSSENDSDTEDGEEDESEELLAIGDILEDIDGKAEYEIISIEKSGICAEFTETVNRKDSVVTIPDKVELEDGMVCKVVSVADSAFKNNKYIKRISVGNNVKIIGKKAFYGCKNLTDIRLGENVETIGANAFIGCVKVKSLTLPSKVKKIGSNAFYGCKKLKTLTIKSTKLTSKGIAKKAFKNLPVNASVKVPKSKLNTYRNLLRQKGLSAKIKITKM